MKLFVIADVVVGQDKIDGALTAGPNAAYVMFNYLTELKGVSTAELDVLVSNEEIALDKTNDCCFVRNIKDVPGGVYVFPIESPAVIGDPAMLMELLHQHFPMDFHKTDEEDPVPPSKEQRYLH